MFKLWTPEMTERMKAERIAGASASQIAKILNREFRTSLSRNAVIGKVHRLGMTQGKPAMPTRLAKPIAPPLSRAAKPAPAARPKPVPRPAPIQIERAPPADLTVIPATARHWIERKPCQCAWPVAGQGYETLSCCAPTQAGSAYCPGHYAAMHLPPKPGMTAATLLRSVRRYL